MRRDARRSGRRGLARDGRITLRRALGTATAVVAGWLLVTGPLSLTPSGGSAASPPPAASSPAPPNGTPTPPPTPPPTPTPTPCHSFFCTTPPPTFGTTPPTATPTPTPAPSPTPTAAPTSVPTSYAESIDPQQTQASIPPTNANVAVVARPTGGGSPISQWALFAIVVFAVTAGTSFFLFFKIR